MDDEDVAEGRLDLDTKTYPIYRIWPASDPVLDTSPEPAHGTVGWHVHAWMNQKAWAEGHKSIDQTYFAVTVDGRPLGKRGKLLKDTRPVFAIVHCPHCQHQHIDRDTPDFAFSKVNHGMHLCTKSDGGCGRWFFTKPNIGVAQLNEVNRAN